MTPPPPAYPPACEEVPRRHTWVGDFETQARVFIGVHKMALPITHPKVQVGGRDATPSWPVRTLATQRCHDDQCVIVVLGLRRKS